MKRERGLVVHGLTEMIPNVGQKCANVQQGKEAVKYDSSVINALHFIHPSAHTYTRHEHTPGAAAPGERLGG